MRMLEDLKYKYALFRNKNKASSTPLAKLYEQSFPEKKRSFLETRFLVVDCEMSGLRPQENDLLSIGWVGIENGLIQAGSAGHIVIRSDKEMAESVLIHGLHDHMVAEGNDLSEVMKAFIKKAEGAVLVFHYAPIDLCFLQKAALSQFGVPLLLPYIDTMDIEKTRLRRRDAEGGIRLQQCRARYGLPDYPKHNALNDAQATAELFLAQAHYKDNISSITLRDFPLRCS